MERHAPAVVERAMKVEEVILRARAKLITWLDSSIRLVRREATVAGHVKPRDSDRLVSAHADLTFSSVATSQRRCRGHRFPGIAREH